MKKHLQYEGPELEQLLDHVHQRHGADANIVKADKDRTGGIAGFFAREVFHVIVEVEHSDSDDGSERSESIGNSSSGSDNDDALWSIVAAAAASSGTEESGAEFAATLGKILDEEPPAPPVVPVTTPVHPVTIDRLPVPTRHEGAVQTVTFPEADVAASAKQAAQVSRIRLRPPAPPGSGEKDGSGSVVALSQRRIQRQVECSESFDDLLIAFESAEHEPCELPLTGIVAVVGCLREAEPLASTMMEVSGGTASDILVLSPTDPQDVPSAAEVIGVAAQLRARRGLSIVVIELQPGLGGHMWATQVLSHLSANQVRLVIGTGRSAEGTTVAIQALERIDVLDLVDVHEISEPERFLELGVPVGSLDSRTPTPALWAAAAVTARMVASSRSDGAITPASRGAE